MLRRLGKKKEKTPERRPELIFHPKEDRGEEEEEEEEEERDGRASSPRRGKDYTDYQERGQSSVRSPRVPLNDTGRAIDDYSSDDDEDERTEVTPVTSFEKTAVVSVEDVDANNTPIRSRRRSASSSSSSSSADDKTPKSQGQGDAAVINVDLLDREEKREQEAAKERERREELRRKEETDLLQKQQAERAQRLEERKKAEEASRQEDLYQQQQRDEQRRQREEQRRREAEEEKQRREEEEERRRHQAQIEDDPDARERQRMESQMLRDEQIRREQQEREEQRKQQEEEREKTWRLEKTRREHKLKMDADERERKRVEEGLSSARSETSTARSTTASSAVSSSAETSSAESTPRNVPAQTLTTQDAEVTRPLSPLPAAAVYEDHRRLREPQDTNTPARPTSPLPPAAMYEDRRQQREREGQAPRGRPVSPRGRPVSPLPPAAVYEDRKAARRAEEEQERARSLAVDAPVPAIQLQTAEDREDQPHTGRSSTTEVSTTATSDDDSDDDDNVSQASLESVDEGRQYTKISSGGIQQQDSGTADSSSDSDTSSGDASARATNIGASTTTHIATVKEGKDLASGPHATSESDGENMHGGADPDNVAQQEEGGELQPLRTRELPAAKAHKGEITDLLPEGTDSVDLSNVLLNKTQVYQLGSHLESSSTVKMVTLCNAGLDDNDLQRLSEALAASPSQPVMLNLSLNSVSQKGIQHVLHALKAKPSIKLLILQGNPIGDAGIKELTQGLQDLHRQARVNRIAGTMETNSDTMSVDSGSSSIDPLVLAQKYLLQELDLTDTQLTDSGAAHMAQLVASNVYVENVNLSHNPRVTAGGGWKQMGEALARNRCIRSLTLDGNQIGDEGIEHLARGLQNNRVLRSLALEDAGIGSEGGKHLMNMLKRNTSLLELTLSPGNTIPDALAEDIGKYIALNRTPYNNFGL